MSYALVGEHGSGSPLALPGLLEFNHRKWGLQPLKVRCTEEGKDLPALEAVLYLDKRGRVCLPPRIPYLPMVFLPTPTPSIPRLSRQWLSVSKQMASEFRRRGLSGTVAFPPEIVDLREWQWQHFTVGVRYTYYVDFPYQIEQAHGDVRRRVTRASRDGYFCRRASALDDVYQCLKGTDERKGISHRLELTLDDLELARELLGDDHLRTYVCYAPNGEAASAEVVLHQPGHRSMAWTAGSNTKYLRSGAPQLINKFSTKDLESAGAAGCDWVGANIPSVANAKSNWGIRLVPYYTVEAPNLRALAKYSRAGLRFREQKPWE
jgi:hypothetical protein